MELYEIVSKIPSTEYKVIKYYVFTKQKMTQNALVKN